MRMLERNKQRMYYSLPNGRVPIYQTNADGTVKYVVIDGVSTPIKTGEFKTGYTTPIEFKGAIFSQLENALERAWGNDSTNNYAVLVVGKNKMPELINNTRIWLYNEVKYNTDGTVDETSANYKVSGIMREELNEDSYYLQVLN